MRCIRLPVGSSASTRAENFRRDSANSPRSTVNSAGAWTPRRAVLPLTARTSRTTSSSGKTSDSPSRRDNTSMAGSPFRALAGARQFPRRGFLFDPTRTVAPSACGRRRQKNGRLLRFPAKHTPASRSGHSMSRQSASIKQLLPETPLANKRNFWVRLQSLLATLVRWSSGFSRGHLLTAELRRGGGPTTGRGLRPAPA